MADNTTLNTGTGGDVIASDDISGVKYQIIKVAYGALDTATLVTSSVGFPVLVATGAASIAKLEDVASADADVGVPAMAIRKATPANTSGTDGDYEMLQMSAGRLWASATLEAGSQVIGHVLLDANSGVDIGKLTANQSVNVAQINAVTPLMGTGIMGTGSPRVTIASDNDPLIVKQATAANLNATVVGTGTLAVQAAIKPQTTGGFTTFHLVSAATTNATAVKASAGQLFGWYIYNSNSTARKVAFHNLASGATAGASIFFTMVIPPLSAANVMTETGIAFSTGISFTTVTGLTDADAVAVGLNDLIINLFYI